jgi:hypothetical protein
MLNEPELSNAIVLVFANKQVRRLPRAPRLIHSCSIDRTHFNLSSKFIEGLAKSNANC